MRLGARITISAAILLLGAHSYLLADGLAPDLHPLPTFDQLVSQKWDGTVPFPPQKLVESLIGLSPDATVDASIFPHGRSLERVVTDFKNPRTVFTYGALAGHHFGVLDQPSSTFFGYTPNKQQLEIISFNPKTREFDFKLVANYGPGLKPVMIDAPKAACMACHQQGGPIFPVLPWSETQLNRQVFNQLKKEKNLEPFAKWLVNKFRIAGDRGPLEDPNDPVRVDPNPLDQDVRAANGILDALSICRDLCGDDMDCKKTLVAGKLFDFDGNPSDSFPGYDSQKFGSKVTENSNNIEFPKSDFLLDRKIEDGNDSSFSAAQDPLTPRKADNGFLVKFPNILLFATKQCFDVQPSDPRITALQKDPERIRSALDSTAMTRLIQKDWPPTLDEILKVVYEVSSPNACVNNSSAPLSAQATQLIDAVPRILSLQKQPPLDLFQTYCIACHVGNLAPKLPLDDLSKLKAYVGVANSDRTVLNLLSQNVMPPAYFPIQPSPENRQEMIDAVKGAR